MKIVYSILLLMIANVTLFSEKIAVVSVAQGERYREMVAPGIENKRDYCKRHNYDLFVAEESLDPSREIYWSKIPYVRSILDQGYDWVVWIDADTLIMNKDIPLETFLNPNYDLLITKDFNGLNTGVFFLKNAPWSKEFLEQVYERVDCLDHIWPEQEAFIRVLEEGNGAADHVKFYPQRMFNSYCSEILRENMSLSTQYRPGDFLLHFAGSDPMHTNWLEKLMRKYAPQTRRAGATFLELDHFLGMYGFALSPLDSKMNEGYISHAQTGAYQKMLKGRGEIKSVLEIGLNGGHSADLFFKTLPNVEYFASFDLGEHQYAHAAVEFFEMKYKNRFAFFQGDSKDTVPAFLRANPNKTFDLIYVDGAHTFEGAKTDILNCSALSHSETVLIIDDYWDQVQLAVDSLVAEGVIELTHVERVHDQFGGRIWAVAKYRTTH